MIEIDGKDATDLPPAKRGLAMVFQTYALYPHMTVRKNIAFPLKMAGMSAGRDQTRKVDGAAKVLNLTNYLDRRPGQLSGGQRQRVAIGRAIVREPAAFLFDEPLSNLDAALRVNMRLEISELHQTLKTTMIYVTHDQVEAMTMADKIVVLNAGRIEQVGSPLELYHAPANLFVAGFIGSPKMNLIDGRRGRQARRHHHRHPARTHRHRRHGAVGRAPSACPNIWAPTPSCKVDVPGTRHADRPRRRRGRRCATATRVYLTPQPGKIHRFGADGKAMA